MHTYHDCELAISALKLARQLCKNHVLITGSRHFPSRIIANCLIFEFLKTDAPFVSSKCDFVRDYGSDRAGDDDSDRMDNEYGDRACGEDGVRTSADDGDAYFDSTSTMS